MTVSISNLVAPLIAEPTTTATVNASLIKPTN